MWKGSGEMNCQPLIAVPINVTSRADHDAQRREHRTHFVRPDRVHAINNPSLISMKIFTNRRSRMSVSFPHHFVTGDQTVPYSMIRRACRATSSSCVTTNIVFPLCERSSNKAMISRRSWNPGFRRLIRQHDGGSVHQRPRHATRCVVPDISFGL